MGDPVTTFLSAFPDSLIPAMQSFQSASTDYVFIWIQGEAESSDENLAADYGLHEQSIFEAMIGVFSDVKIFSVLLNDPHRNRLYAHLVNQEKLANKTMYPMV